MSPRARFARGCSVAAVALALCAGPAAGQFDAIPQTVFGAQAVVMSEAQLDSACAARALPLAGSALFGGLRDAIGRARLSQVETTLPPAQATVRAVTMTAGWYVVLLFIGLAMLVFAGDRLRQVTETLERDTVGALLTGLVASLASVPLLVAAVVVLALTIIGVLLIPFAVVAIVLLYAGLALLGFLAVASVLGRAVLGERKARMSERSVALMGLLTGLTVLLAAWLGAALFTWSPTTELVLRSMALGLTAVAITAGAGAVIRSFRAAGARAAVQAPVIDEIAWQTPTPVSGVVAVRRSGG
jgi:MFS family permease